MKRMTEYGLLVMILGLIFAIISSLVSLASNGTVDIGSISGLCFLIGIILMALGRKEYGEKHARNVIISIIFFVATIVVMVILISFVVYSAVSTNDLSGLKMIFYIIPVAAVLNGIVYILLVYELENSFGKKILIGGFVVSIAISLSVFVFFIPDLDSMIDELQNELDDEDDYYSSSYFGEDFTESYYSRQQEREEKIAELQSDASKYGALGIFGQILFLIAFYIPYKRIKDGELQQVLPGHIKRCMNCGRVNPSDAKMCAYCSSPFSDNSYNNLGIQQNFYKY